MAFAPEMADAASNEPDEEIQGRSPARIALERIRRDKIAVISAVVVLLFLLIAIFAPLIADLFGVGYREQSGTETLDATTGFGKVGPPVHGFSWEHPLGVAPGNGYDLLGEWLYGACTSFVVLTLAIVFSTVVGVVVGHVSGLEPGWVVTVY